MPTLTAIEQRAVAAAYRRLPERHRLAVACRYPPAERRRLTLREIGVLLDVSPERARQLAHTGWANLVRALARTAAGQEEDWTPLGDDFRAAATRLDTALREGSIELDAVPGSHP